MSRKRFEEFDPKTVAAIQELEALILAQYPGTTFEITGDPDDEDIILLWATADVDDPDEVGDLVLDRMLEIQLNDGIPVYLVPISTPERNLAQLKANPRPRRLHPIHLSIG